jgi:hypothetical protein
VFECQPDAFSRALRPGGTRTIFLMAGPSAFMLPGPVQVKICFPRLRRADRMDAFLLSLADTMVGRDSVAQLLKDRTSSLVRLELMEYARRAKLDIVRHPSPHDSAAGFEPK